MTARNDEMRAEVLSGLSADPKRLPPKFFYDARGSELFEAITELPEYYPTRCELEILRSSAGEIAAALGDDLALIELGSGSSRKVRFLLDALQSVRAYVPIDISPSALDSARQELRKSYPSLDVLPVVADYSAPFELPPLPPSARRVVFYPGSTIGNLTPVQAVAFLRRIVATLRAGDAVLIGYDLVKPRKVLEAAYDDPQGVTAAFNKNMLRHLNRALGADFDEDGFRHEAFFNSDASRIEMHLRSTVDQIVDIGGASVHFGRGERLHTESSYKFDVSGFARLARAAGLTPQHTWTDAKRWFAVSLFVYPGV